MLIFLQRGSFCISIHSQLFENVLRVYLWAIRNDLLDYLF
jgi:hypothetical protein